MASANRPVAANPIFVVGYMHSGTTLMYRILGRNPSLFSGDGETKFFEFLPAITRRFPNLGSPEALRAFVEYTLADVLGGFSFATFSNSPGGSVDEEATRRRLDPQDVNDVLTALPPSPQPGDVFRCACEHLARRSGKPRWLEKTPTHVFHIEDILRAVPDALFIEIVRDPRDVLASKKTRRANVWSPGRYNASQRQFKHLEKAYDPLWDALSWKSAIAAGRRAKRLHPERVYRISYEALVTEPEQTVRGFCNFLGLAYDPMMLEVTLQTSADWNSRRQDAGIYSQSVGRWHDALEPAEIALIQLITDSDLVALGYSAEPLSPGMYAGAVELAMRAQAQLFVRLFRRWKMGGVPFLASVTRAYIERLRVLARR